MQDARFDSWTDFVGGSRESWSAEMGFRRFWMSEVDMYVLYRLSGESGSENYRAHRVLDDLDDISLWVTFKTAKLEH